MNIDEMPAGRELDALVAERLGLPLEPPCPRYHDTDSAQYDEGYGWIGWCYSCGEVISAVAPEPLHYSTDIAAAWLVVEWMRAKEMHNDDPEGWRFIDCGSDGWRVEIVFYPDHDAPAVTQEAVAETFPLAICRAALKALS